MRDAFTFLVSVKITWLQRIAEEFSYSELVMDIYPDLSTLRNYGGEYANIQMLRIENPFWKDVLKHYKKLCIKCTPLIVDEFMSENVHYHINITKERKVVYNREWYANNILSIKQLWVQMETFSILKNLDISFHKPKFFFWYMQPV